MIRNEVRAVRDWLIDGERLSPGSSQPALAALCDRLVACGIPLWRVALFVRTLHPQILGRRILWRQGAKVEVIDAPYGSLDGADFRGSPIARVFASGVAIRRRLADAECPNDFPILDDLRAEGTTDYLVSPLVFTNGDTHVVSWSTRQPGGFNDEQIAGIGTIIAPLARIVEIITLRRTGSSLLDTYVGRQSGERILAGHIRLGDIEVIHAAIWLSDMRGFTALADRLPSQTLLDLLNDYFECQVSAILGRGGEVLKFMGDGLLAIFPIMEKDSDIREVCNNVLAAARDARTKVAAMESYPAVNGNGRRFGLALHVGEVLYGNIGGGNRLDFTCIGPAVNLAARIEKLAGELKRSILASGEFARHCLPEMAPVGEFTFRGFGTPQMVFGLPDETRHEN